MVLFSFMGKTNTKIRIGFKLKSSETQIVFLLVKIGLRTCNSFSAPEHKPMFDSTLGYITLTLTGLLGAN